MHGSAQSLLAVDHHAFDHNAFDVVERGPGGTHHSRPFMIAVVVTLRDYGTKSDREPNSGVVDTFRHTYMARGEGRRGLSDPRSCGRWATRPEYVEGIAFRLQPIGLEPDKIADRFRIRGSTEVTVMLLRGRSTRARRPQVRTLQHGSAHQSAGLRVIASMAALLLVAAGCGSDGESSTPGVTSTTITIGSHQPLTGTTSAAYSGVAPAAKAYFDFVNDHGGVHGRRIIYAYRDDAYTPSNAVQVVPKLVEQDKVFAIFNGLGTGPHSAVVNYLNKHKVPDLFPASGCPCWNDPGKLPYTFGWQTDLTREGKILGFYMKRKFPGKRIAYLYQDDGYGRGGVKGLDLVVPSSLVVTRQKHPIGVHNLDSQIQAIIRAKADVIIAFTQPAYAALLRLTQLRLGNNAQLAVSFGGIDQDALAALPSTSSPIITDTFLTPISETSSSWNRLMKRVHDKYAPTQPFDQWFVYGMSAAYTFVEALQRNGRNLTRESLTTTLEKGGISPGPGLTPFDFSTTQHGGYTGAQIASIQGTAYTLQGQPLTTDGGNGPVVPVTAPLPPAPSDGLPAP